jgi:outer membrane receptor protein involved in Fe transport
MKQIVCALLIVTGAAAQTAPPPQPSSEEKELTELLSIVQQETDVATKTRLNSDYVPGIVTVLEGDELEALGIRTAGEALGLVPGIQNVRDNRGSDLALVRGLDFPFNAGNIQVVVNSILIARQDGGINTSALQIPVEQIERIEVIRGPGSVIYGDFAFMGLVNIITRKEGTRVLGRVESPHASRLAALRFGGRESGSAYSANVSASNSTDAAAPLPVANAGEQRVFSMFNAEARGFSLTAQSVHRNYTPPAGPGAVRFHETSWVAEAKYARDVSAALHAEARLTFLRNDINDFVSSIAGDMTRVGADVTYTGLRHNSILAGADYSLSTLDEAFHRAPPPPGAPPGPPVLSLLARNKHRDVAGLLIQDRVDLSEKLSMTAGARYDSYSDLSSRVTPRLSFVWRATEHHILKAQYTEGFRPPTFFELYTPPAPVVVPRYPWEVNATTEVNYVYRDTGRVARVTLFRSDISNMLRPGGVFFTKDGHAKGVELEWTQELSPRLKFGANVSHVDTTDPRAPNGGENTVSANWLGNAMLLVHAAHNIVIAGRWNYVGRRVAGDGYETLDVTMLGQDLFVPGLSLRIGAKDMFNGQPSYFTQLPTGGILTNTFPGRSAWVEVSWKR